MHWEAKSAIASFATKGSFRNMGDQEKDNTAKRDITEVDSDVSAPEETLKKVKYVTDEKKDPQESKDIDEEGSEKHIVGGKSRDKETKAPDTSTLEASSENSPEKEKEIISIHNEESKDGESDKKSGVDATEHTKTNDKSSESKHTSPESQETPQVKPAFTFGASSSFSSGFGVASKPFGASSSFGSGFSVVKKAISNDMEGTGSKPNFSFGSGLSFGAGFKAVKSENKEKLNEESNTGSVGKEETPAETDGLAKSLTNIPESVVKLTKQEIKSGEESEESVFQTNAKLYQLTDIKEGWKERGIGILHLNKDKLSEKSRIIMRSRGLLKVILNLPLIKGFSIQKGFPGSLNGEKFVRILAVDENKQPVQYAIKTGKSETATELYDKVTELVPEN